MNRLIYIDKRPLALLFLIEYWKAFLLILLISVFIFMISIPPPEGFTVSGWKALNIFILCVLFWITDIIPRAITGLLAIVLIPTLNILPKSLSYSLFGNEAIFFILGAFLIAAAYSSSGLDKRISIYILYKLSLNSNQLLITLLFFAGFLSLWMPEHAVAAILYPVVLDIKKHIPVNIGPHFIKGLLFAVIWGCSIGGVGTFLGGARNPLAISLLNEMTGTSISFIEWMIAVIPFVIVTLMLAAIILRHYFKCNFDVTDIQNELLEKRKWIGKVSFKEYLFALIFLLTIFSWMFAGNWLGVTNIALISSVLLFVLKLVSWREASEFIQWDILLMYGGAISIGAALHKTNALTPIVNWIFSEIYFSPIVIIISISVIAIILTEGISNAAVVILLLPIAINLTASQNIDPRIITLAVAVPSGLAFMMPIGNPPNALCYSSGLYTISDSARYGIVMNITSLIIFLIVVKVYWPIIGLSIP